MEGAELAAFIAHRKREKDVQAERQRLEEEQKRLKRERLELYDDAAEIDDSFSLAMAWRGYDLYADRVRLEFERAASKDYAASDERSPPPPLMFPAIERRAVFDRYGEVPLPLSLALSI